MCVGVSVCVCDGVGGWELQVGWVGGGLVVAGGEKSVGKSEWSDDGYEDQQSIGNSNSNARMVFHEGLVVTYRQEGIEVALRK